MYLSTATKTPDLEGATMSEAWDSTPDYVDGDVARAMAHPMRIQILAELNQRVMSPSEFSERFDLKLSNVSYHFRELRKLDCIECIETRPARGAMEHFYKATKRALFDGKPWDQLPESIRAKVSGQIIGDFLCATAKAMLAETVDARKDRHLTWTETRFDTKGWEEATLAYREFLNRMVVISREAKARLDLADEPGLMAIYGLFLFESPMLEPEQEAEDEP
jgi:DNA-binding transcriptional ArsR family regulator